MLRSNIFNSNLYKVHFIKIGTKFMTPGLSSLFYQALQKDIQANVKALNEVISSTKKFLEENRSKLTPEQVATIERKIEEVKSKANMLNQRAEETRKELEKVVTTVIEQEKEKVGQFILLLVSALRILASCKYSVKKKKICIFVFRLQLWNNLKRPKTK